MPEVEEAVKGAESGETAVAQERRTQILDAAWRTFSRRGFHQATMQDICREADLSPGSVYRYFPGKDDLIVALVARDTAESVSVIETLHDHDDPFAALLELLDVSFKQLRDVRTCATNVEIESEAARNPRVGALVRRSDAELAAALAGLLLRLGGERHSIDDADALARVLIAVFIGISAQKAISPELDVDSHARVLRQLLELVFFRNASDTAPSAEAR